VLFPLLYLHSLDEHAGLDWLDLPSGVVRTALPPSPCHQAPFVVALAWWDAQPVLMGCCAVCGMDVLAVALEGTSLARATCCGSDQRDLYYGAGQFTIDCHICGQELLDAPVASWVPEEPSGEHSFVRAPLQGTPL